MSNSYKGAAFTCCCDKLSNALFSKLKMKSALQPNKEIEILALWDTGATSSVIHSEIAKELGLHIVSECYCSTPSGVFITNQYYVNIMLPNKLIIPDLLVSEGAMLNCQMLVGMDIIGRGDFVVSNYDNKTTFSFRIPSLCELDFVKKTYQTPATSTNSIGRNDVCPCGSGKKYKKCCGK